jgi:hypothetical protein
MDVVGQQLLAQIGACIDQNARPSLVLDQDRGPRPAVLRLAWIAKAPIGLTIFTTDARHAGRCAAAQHHELHAIPFPARTKPRIITEIISLTLVCLREKAIEIS